MPKLTQAFVGRLKSAERDEVIWDDDLPGYGIRSKPSGVRSYLIQYRNAEGRSRRYTLGRYGVLTPDEGRRKARRLLAAVAEGQDPASQASETRSAPSIAELADRYISDHALAHKKASSIASDRRMIEAHIKPKLGKVKVAGLSRAEVARLHHGMRETPYEANRTLAVFSKMLNLAEAWGLRPDGSNPCRHVKRYREQKRTRFLSGDELAAVGKVLAEAEQAGNELPGVIAAIRLLALTGCRMGEILSLKRGHVDFEHGTIQLAEAKAGARSVALGAPALSLLAGMSQKSPFVVHGPDERKPLSRWTLEGGWRRIRAKAGLVNARLHDFRHTVGTYGGQAGFNAFVVRDLLGHKTLAMTGRYVERDFDPMRAAANQVSGRIAAAMEGKEGQVVPLAPVKRQG